MNLSYFEISHYIEYLIPGRLCLFSRAVTTGRLSDMLLKAAVEAEEESDEGLNSEKSMDTAGNSARLHKAQPSFP